MPTSAKYEKVFRIAMTLFMSVFVAHLQMSLSAITEFYDGLHSYMNAVKDGDCVCDTSFYTSGAAANAGAGVWKQAVRQNGRIHYFKLQHRRDSVFDIFSLRKSLSLVAVYEKSPTPRARREQEFLLDFDAYRFGLSWRLRSVRALHAVERPGG